MKHIKYIIITPFRYINKLISRVFYLFILKVRNVEYKSMPLIIGKLVIHNSGTCRFGENLTFRGSLTSNMVGLYKPCTIAVKIGSILSIDDNSGFSGVSIYCSNSITIGKYVNCGGNVSIWDTDFHPLNYEARRVHDVSQIATAPVIIEDDVFIGANSIILKGVTIGKRAVIGAGSVVTKNIPADEIWAGNPARFIKRV
jgi:acetyltransferase-like isoleucine patch superfamily enzyme